MNFDIPERNLKHTRKDKFDSLNVKIKMNRSNRLPLMDR